MAKKEKLNVGAKSPEGAGLKHNPFAALAGQAASAGEAGSSASEGAGPSPSPSTDTGKTTGADSNSATGKAASARSPSPGETGKGAGEKVKSRGRLVLRRETKHRGGKAVIIVRGFDALKDFDDAKVAELAKELKQKLGCGGTVERGDGEVEIVLQGDRAAKVADLLRAQNFRVDGVTS